MRVAKTFLGQTIFQKDAPITESAVIFAQKEPVPVNEAVSQCRAEPLYAVRYDFFGSMASKAAQVTALDKTAVGIPKQPRCTATCCCILRLMNIIYVVIAEASAYRALEILNVQTQQSGWDFNGLARSSDRKFLRASSRSKRAEDHA